MLIKYLFRRIKKSIFFLTIFLRENSLFLIFKILIYSLLKKEKFFKVKINHSEIFIRASITDLSVAINNLIEEYSFMSIDPSTRGIVIDAGGFIGTSAIMLSKIYPNLKIISIEPSKLNFDLLLVNVSKYKNIIPMHRALVGNNSIKSIYLHGRKTGNWGFTTIPNSKLEDRHRYEKTETVTVNKLLKQHHAERIKFFKIDIEGGEVDLLESSKSWIRKTDIIFIELHDRIHNNCSMIFNEKSFKRLNLKITGEKYLSIFSR